MGYSATILGLTIALAVLGGTAYLERRPQQVGRVRLIPYPAVMFLALVVALLFLAHLLTLSGARNVAN